MDKNYIGGSIMNKEIVLLGLFGLGCIASVLSVSAAIIAYRESKRCDRETAKLNEEIKALEKLFEIKLS